MRPAKASLRLGEKQMKFIEFLLASCRIDESPKLGKLSGGSLQSYEM